MHSLVANSVQRHSALALTRCRFHGAYSGMAKHACMPHGYGTFAFVVSKTSHFMFNGKRYTFPISACLCAPTVVGVT